jgi:hypothetical protein
MKSGGHHSLLSHFEPYSPKANLNMIYTDASGIQLTLPFPNLSISGTTYWFPTLDYETLVFLLH